MDRTREHISPWVGPSFVTDTVDGARGAESGCCAQCLFDAADAEPGPGTFAQLPGGSSVVRLEDCAHGLASAHRVNELSGVGASRLEHAGQDYAGDRVDGEAVVLLVDGVEC